MPDALEQIYLELQKPVPQAPATGLFDFFKKPASTKVRGVKGLYLWGGVGRGKTYLVVFHESLPFEQKIRTANRLCSVFMRIEDLGGRQDPLQIVLIVSPKRPGYSVLTSFTCPISPMPCCWGACSRPCSSGCDAGNN